ncbi:MAG: response regulator [Anaerolineae bacterium]|nr:response regulator [Anaerolineae bacterium]
MTVIYIEDDETEALLFRLGMGARGIEVLHIPDTQSETLAALDTPEYQAAAAIFVDLWVGTLNGIEVSQFLRSRGDVRPIFLLTAGENPNAQLLQDLNVTYLQKPANFANLAAMIKKLL